MKYLSNYTQDAQTKLFNELGAFFAFSNKQLDDQKVDGVEYVAMGSGLVIPKENAPLIMDRLDNIQKEGIALDIAENGKEAIIMRELGNHEAQITGDLDDTIESLQGYNISVEDIKKQYRVFFQQCIDNDWF